MKTFKSLIISLLATFALPFPVDAAEINCNSPVWKNKPVCNKKKAKLKEPNFCKDSNLTAIQKEECLSIKTKIEKKNAKKNPKYPVVFANNSLTMWKQKHFLKDQFFWKADTKTVLTINKGLGGKKFETIYEIPTERIISYEQSLVDMSDNAAQLATNVGITAVFVPILAIGQGINYRKMEHYKWKILFIDEYGREITQELYPISELPAADRYYTFLSDLTGLKNGETRSSKFLETYYLDGINKFTEKLEKDFVNLSTYNSVQSCKELDTSSYPLSTNIFLEEKKQLDSLRERFGYSPYVITGSCS